MIITSGKSTAHDTRTESLLCVALLFNAACDRRFKLVDAEAAECRRLRHGDELNTLDADPPNKREFSELRAENPFRFQSRDVNYLPRLIRSCCQQGGF